MANPLTQDGAPRTVVILLVIWLAVVLAVAAGVVLGAWALTQYFAAYLADVGQGWVGAS